MFNNRSHPVYMQEYTARTVRGSNGVYYKLITRPRRGDWVKVATKVAGIVVLVVVGRLIAFYV